ncbi:WD40 repeat protein [Balamuthia mandrillaris]
MYFAVGWPKVLANVGETIVDLQHADSGSLFAVLSLSGLYIWSAGKETVLLANLHTHPSILDKYGAHKSLLWNREGTCIAVLTVKGALFLFTLRTGSDEYGDIQLKEEDRTCPLISFSNAINNNIHNNDINNITTATTLYSSSPTKASTSTTSTSASTTEASDLLLLQSGKQLLVKASKRLLMPYGGGVCAVRNERHQLCVATKGGFLLILSWKGELLEERSLSSLSLFRDRQQPQQTQRNNIKSRGSGDRGSPAVNAARSKMEEPSDIVVVDMAFSLELCMFVVVLADGKVAVLSSSTPTTIAKGGEDGKEKGGEGVWATGRWLVSSSSSGSKSGSRVNASKKVGEENKACCCGIHPAHRIAAVGFSNGDVKLFDLSPSKQVSEALLRTLTPQNNHAGSRSGSSTNSIGAVSCLEWSRDGRVVAVGHAHGLSVWSLHGCRLMSTFSAFESRKPGQDHASQYYEGIRALSWDKAGYRLLGLVAEMGDSSNQPLHPVLTVAATTQKQKDKGALVSGHVVQFSFVKSGSVLSPATGYSQHTLLQGEDHVLLLYGERTGSMDWQILQLPYTYMADNWPVYVVAVNRGGTDIAVAGRRGITVYNTALHRWRLFGDRNEEQQIHCQALCWYQDVVVVANAGPHNKNELLFYPKQHLANSALLRRVPVLKNRRPISLDCNDRSLVVFTADAYLYQYLITPSINGQGSSVLFICFSLSSFCSLFSPVRALLLFSFSLHASTDMHNGKCTELELTLIQRLSVVAPSLEDMSLLLLPPPTPSHVSQSSSSSSSPRNNQEPTRCLMLNSKQRVLALSDSTFGSIKVADAVEAFWLVPAATSPVSSSSNNLPQRTVALWTYSTNGLQLWYPSSLLETGGGGSMKGGEEARLMVFDFNSEVYPVGFVPSSGVVLALTSVLSFSPVCSVPRFKLQIQTYPYLHSLLQQAMNTTKDTDNLLTLMKDITCSYNDATHLSQSLELLFYDAFNKDLQNRKLLASSQENLSSKGAATPISNRDEGHYYEFSDDDEDDDDKDDEDDEDEDKKTSPRRQMSINGIDSSGNKNVKQCNTSPRKSNNEAEVGDEEKDTSALGRVIAFLRNSCPQHFAEVVVNCARKTDAAFWSFLFERIGETPLAMFEACLATGEEQGERKGDKEKERGGGRQHQKLQTAAAYLQIIRYMEGQMVSTRCACTLLEVALDRGQLSLVHDILHFVHAPVYNEEKENEKLKSEAAKKKEQEEQERKSKQLTKKKEEGKKEGEEGEEEEEGQVWYEAIEVLLRRHARKLLEQKKLAALLHFAGLVSRPLRPWLRLERERAAALLRGEGMDEREQARALLSALHSLHVQFCLPYPSSLPLPVPSSSSSSSASPSSTMERLKSSFIGRRNSIEQKEEEQTNESSSSSTNEGQTSKGDKNASYYEEAKRQQQRAIQRDVDYLFSEMWSAECMQWALLLATVLLKVSHVLAALQRSPSLRQPYLTMLTELTAAPTTTQPTTQTTTSSSASSFFHHFMLATTSKPEEEENEEEGENEGRGGGSEGYAQLLRFLKRSPEFLQEEEQEETQPK